MISSPITASHAPGIPGVMSAIAPKTMRRIAMTFLNFERLMRSIIDVTSIRHLWYGTMSWSVYNGWESFIGMALSVGIGKGKDRDPFEAGRNAARDVTVQMKNVSPHALIVFCASSIDKQRFLDGVRSIFPEAPLVGSTTAGHGTREELLDDGGVLMGLAGADPKDFVSASASGVHEGEKGVVETLLSALSSKIPLSKLSTLLTFSDGLAGSGTALMSSFGAVPSLRGIVGGFSGDGMAFKETHQFEGKNILRDSVVGLGISGVSVGLAGEHGWKPIGIPMKATKAEGALLMELDGNPAFSMYEKYFGDMSREIREETMSRLALTYPLGVAEGETMLVRAPLSVDDAGGILCGAEVPVGASVRLLLGSKDAMLSAASRAGHRAKSALGGRPPGGAIVVSSMTRRKILGSETLTEIRAVSDALGTQCPIIFMYGYGEFYPVTGAPSVFQNESIVVLALAG